MTFESRAATSVMLGVLLWLLALVAGAGGSCAGTSANTAAVRAELGAYRTAIDPAYRTAVKVCGAADRAVFQAQLAGMLTRAQADELIGANRLRCDAVVERFEGLRIAHTRAAEAFERGDVGAAQAELVRVRELWPALVPEETQP